MNRFTTALQAVEHSDQEAEQQNKALRTIIERMEDKQSTFKNFQLKEEIHNSQDDDNDFDEQPFIRSLTC